MTAKVEAIIGPDQEWSDLTKYMQAGGEHAMVLRPTGRVSTAIRDPRVRGGAPVGPHRHKRAMAYRARVLELPQRLEITGGTGNWMVNLCRSGTAQAARDKAARQRGGDGQTAPKHPNDRLRHYGLKVKFSGTVLGGTARQRACYLRAVDRYMLWDYRDEQK